MQHTCLESVVCVRRSHNIEQLIIENERDGEPHQPSLTENTCSCGIQPLSVLTLDAAEVICEGFAVGRMFACTTLTCDTNKNERYMLGGLLG